MVPALTWKIDVRLRFKIKQQKPLSGALLLGQCLDEQLLVTSLSSFVCNRLLKKLNLSQGLFLYIFW
jgi:hypothetical protein